MPVKTIYKNKRKGKDRRKLFSTYNGVERRKGVDRRKLDEKLKHMIERGVKEQKEEKEKPAQPQSGIVVRRRKGEKDKTIP